MSKFFAEVNQQPSVIRETIRLNEDVILKPTKPFLFTGMGSSLAASELLVSYLNHFGIQASAIDNSELLYYYSDEFLNKHQVFVISQSGESFEAIELAKRYPNITAITNSPGSSLAEKASRVLYTVAGKEEAIASSKSFTTTVALLLLLGSKIVGGDLAADLYHAVDILEGQFVRASEYQEQIGKFINPNHPLVLLGRGPSIYTARQGSLTLKETARMYVEALSAPQFRHGPFELIKEDLQAIFFNPEGITHDINQKYVLEMAELGAKVLYVSDEALEHENISSIVIPSVNEFVSVITYSFVIQLAAVELSSQRGLVAGEAELISKVTRKE
ncbi:SIS domain-containing protein [Neobacillus sp. PS2-9]|uniref:SIS domain-containing protein n=1 Tax=Neobacillus sp. PS2-9 TaxID=3070676 RepID=UPI0027DEB9E3|nr:SIS domain-containing protein [Neobacillus sp. PS2-9]WML58639.1 SIS domain-containing protein [Neobacillus sp. PS2-9]